jgi:hypothetical protein
VFWDEGAVDDPRVVAVLRCGQQAVGRYRHQVVDDSIEPWIDVFDTVRPRRGWSGWCADG